MPVRGNSKGPGFPEKRGCAMTNELTNLFEGHDIRVLEKDGEIWFPIYDLSKAWGIDDSTIFKQIERHPDDFSGCVSDVDNLSTGMIKCVNEPGLYAVLAISSVKNVKNPGARDVIRKFRAAAPKLIQQYRKKEIAPIKCEILEDLVRQHLQIADSMAQFAHVDRGIAVSVALARVEYDTGADLTCYKNLIRKERQQAPGYLTPTQIGQELGGLSAHNINKMLVQLGYQYFLGDRWQPTEIGKNFGENLPFAVSLKSGGVHSDYQLKWSPEMVRKLRDHLNGTNQVQTLLPAHG